MMEKSFRFLPRVLNVRPYTDRAYFLNRQKNRKYERGYRDKSFAM